MSETQIITLIVLIILSAFFSAIETALMSLNIIKVKSLVRQRKKGAEVLHRIKQDPHKLIITILIGNNLVNIGAASLATVLFTDVYGSHGVGIATGVMTFLILVFGEITPKTFAAQNAERISLAVARPIELLSIILSPLVRLFELISKFMSKLLGSKKEKQLSEEELSTIVAIGKREGILSKEAADMMHNVLRFENIKVTEIMTPMVDMEIIDGNKRIGEIIDFVIRMPYSRYPVYLKNKNKVIGILDVDDVLKYVKNKRLNVKVKSIIRDAYFVPESKEIDDLLTEFEGKSMPMAIVVDEYEQVSGLVTVEDILEEIVGDIFDKSKRRSVYIKKINDKLFRVDGRATIGELNRHFNLELKGGNFDTVAGFIEHKIKKIPERGEKIKLKKITFEVNKVSKQGIKSVLVIKN